MGWQTATWLASLGVSLGCRYTQSETLLSSLSLTARKRKGGKKYRRSLPSTRPFLNTSTSRGHHAQGRTRGKVNRHVKKACTRLGDLYMPLADMDFSTNYCTVCDVAHEKGGLYCSLKCRKRDAKAAKAATSSPTKASTETMSSLMDRSRSNISLYALSNPSTTSISSTTNARKDSLEAPRDAAKATRPPLDRRLSAQRPLPPVKRSSYSSSVPKSLDLVTPLLAPLTKQGETCSDHSMLSAYSPEVKSPLLSPGLMYPVQPAGTRFNHMKSDSPDDGKEPRRMFFFKRVQSDDPVYTTGSESDLHRTSPASSEAIR